ncbi:hypothetical protein M2306_001755 [Myroides gitamensis]|uniref:hypothetical protein n=1 Tax=Myroides odoratus TaxID=256 RepID=UPI002167025F|nr:hypothetical protein [Myroides odoratus]MCS4240187.1 hypothetical protein [Myroides odoratus]MDH6601061.1 hypothetical protein [Myroides gitamensis]
MIIASKNTIDKTQYERLVNEKELLINQLENVNQFFCKNPKTAKFFKEWRKRNNFVGIGSHYFKRFTNVSGLGVSSGNGKLKYHILALTRHCANRPNVSCRTFKC